MGEMADEIAELADIYLFTERNVTCRFCGKKDLHWQLNRRGKWRLHENASGLRHACRRRQACAHEFPVCSGDD